MHFFNPVDRMPLVEVIRGAETDDSSLATVYELARRLDKIPIIVADRPGFLVNRLLVTYLIEACVMVEEGCDWQSLERQATTFGMPMGPFRLVDEVGVDIAMEVGHTLTDAFDYLPTSQLLDKLLSAGLLGKKGGQGFYDYTDGKKTTPNPALTELLPTEARPAADSDWERLMLVMVAEATRCLHEKVIESAADIDTGMIFGTGFPPFRGGLCRWSDNTYGERLTARLNTLADSHGERFRPAGDIDRFYS
jgi:3-hydroxyacyl-CoA dehydrogenase